MEELRKQILLYLEKHSRVDLGELAVLLGTDEVTVANEISAMERAKIICGYHTLIEVKVTPQRDTGFDKTAERICNYPEVSAVYLISGDFDMMVLIEGKTLQEVSKFVSSKLSPIEDVTGTSTQFVLKKYKDHGTIMFGQKKPERMLITP